MKCHSYSPSFRVLKHGYGSNVLLSLLMSHMNGDKEVAYFCEKKRTISSRFLLSNVLHQHHQVQQSVTLAKLQNLAES